MPYFFKLITLVYINFEHITCSGIMMGRNEIKEVKEDKGERARLLRKNRAFVPRRGCRNLEENEIKVEGIYYDRRCAQGKAGQSPTLLSLK